MDTRDDVPSDSSALGRYLLARLERCARLVGRADVEALPQWRRLARHAAYSTYCDCVALGLEREARAALRGTDRPAPSVR